LESKLKRSIPGIISLLEELRDHRLEAFAGFDACIDTIVRAVRDRDSDGLALYFSSTEEFGTYLASLNGKSCGIELETKISKPGGNMLITSNALGTLGVKTQCAGTFGIPGINPAFLTVSENCFLHTIAETITATAIEFSDSKVIIFDPGSYRELTWESLKDRISAAELADMIRGKDLVAFVNWSEIEHSTSIWKGFLEEVLPAIPIPSLKPVCICDLSDCSRKSPEEIRYALQLLGEFRKYFSVTLSLNQNEAAIVSSATGQGAEDEEALMKTIQRISGVDCLVIHRTTDALAFDGKNFENCSTFFCSAPAVLTGGGDNFNAGYSFARACGMSTCQSLLLGNAVSGYYVKTGLIPGISELISFLRECSG
jgi:hypothetical protein